MSNKYSEIREDFKEMDYIGINIILRYIIIIIIFIVFGCFGYYSVNKWQKNADREIFKESISYNEAASEFLADSYFQYNKTENTSEKDQICSYVRLRYPNLDLEKIDNIYLRDFYSNCLMGDY